MIYWTLISHCMLVETNTAMKNKNVIFFSN